VRHRARARLARNFDLALGDQRARDRRAQEIFTFIDRVGAKHREHEVAHELLAQIVDEDLLHARGGGLGACGFELFALPDVGREGDHLALVGLLQPFQDDGGVETTGISEYDLIDCHQLPSPCRVASCDCVTRDAHLL